MNIANSSVSGFQVSALNYSRDEIHGFQGGFVNWTVDANGMQLGLLNRATSVNGLQLGVVNVTETLDGLQIGLINVAVKKESFPFMVLVNAEW